MTVATFVIPVSPKHYEAGLYHTAIEAVRAQTIPSVVIVEIDHHGSGAGATRNRAMQKVTTPFAVFLDADDTVKPTFVEDCLKYYREGVYVYTDWVLNGLIVNTPTCLNMWNEGQEHVITTLLPVSAWQDVGGFDETLDTLEDEDFYRKLHAFGWCGVRCPEPLVTYRRHLGESLVNKDTVAEPLQKRRVEEKHALFLNRYRRFMHMKKDCGCGKQIKQATKLVGDPAPNDVLVETLYTPMRVEGAITKRLYPRTGLGAPLWVDIDDAKAQPKLFKIIGHKPEEISPDVETVKKLTEQALNQAPASTPNYDEMTRAELLEYAETQGIEVVGTGANGYVKRDDLLDALA